jgi:DNA excision repair protein ERCC-2
VATFPYTYRPHQEELVSRIRSCLEGSGHIVLEAATGTGKTIALLSGALDAIPEGARRRIVYTTRTHSQQAQAILEAQRLQATTRPTLKAVALQGRHHLCLKLEDQPEEGWDRATPEELSHYCSSAKRRADEAPEDPKGCSYWPPLGALDDAMLATTVGTKAQTADALKGVAREHGFCPYEATKRLLPTADLVVAPYNYVFDPHLRSRLFEWMQTTPKDVLLIVDEAHNVPDFVRGLFSPRMTRARLRLALKEATELSDPEVLPGRRASAIITTLAALVDDLVQKFSPDDDGFLPPFELEARLLQTFTTTTPRLKEAARSFSILGELIRDRRRLAGRVPRSALGNLGAFLEHWLDSDDETAAKMVGREPDGYIESFLVDTAQACRFLTELAGSVHASGTLAPLEEYRDALGLGEDTHLHMSPSPFDPKGLRTLVTRGLTTRYESLKDDPRLTDRLQEATRAFAAATGVKTAVFFPSHDLLAQFRDVGVFEGLPHPVIQEERGMPQAELAGRLAEFRRLAGPALLVGVLGGRLSEGIDYPGRDLEAMIVIGTPYPKPSAHQRALLQWFEKTAGRGWEYTVTAPAARRLRQGLGRIRRRPEDQGLAIILDQRAAGLLAAFGHPNELVEPAVALDALRAWRPDDTFKSTPQMER